MLFQILFHVGGGPLVADEGRQSLGPGKRGQRVADAGAAAHLVDALLDFPWSIE
ncbi:MAG: hypothetical protein ACE10K_11040 [Rhodothermales bacterium]